MKGSVRDYGAAELIRARHLSTEIHLLCPQLMPWNHSAFSLETETDFLEPRCSFPAVQANF